MSDEVLTYTASETAKLLHCSPRLVYRLAANGKLPAFRLGPKKILIRAKALHEMVNSNGTQPEDHRGGAE